MGAAFHQNLDTPMGNSSAINAQEQAYRQQLSLIPIGSVNGAQQYRVVNNSEQGIYQGQSSVQGN
jgi:hypothetical protein